MAKNEIAAAARALCEEKGISLDDVIETIESALAAAYRKDYGEKNQNIKSTFDLDTGETKFYDEKTVVEDVPEEEVEEESDDAESKDKSSKDSKEKEVGKKEIVNPKSSDGASSKKDDDKSSSKDQENEEEKRRFNPRTELQISEAKELSSKYKLGDVIKTDLEVKEDYGRMAAQTAKQVIIQRVREIERANVYDEFKDKEHEVITGVVQRREGRIVLVDLGKTTGVIPPDGQVPGENYTTGQRIKIYVESVNVTAKGPEILLSRTSEEIVRKIFYVEIPEIANGLIEIKAVSREAGSRSKIAVIAHEENVDPIGSCVGQRGARIQTIIEELGGEKVDIIEYSEDAVVFIAKALAPAKVNEVKIDDDSKVAVAMVDADQLSLAIGKGGQNVRLAARLTKWKIDVQESKGSKKEDTESSDDEVEEATEEIESLDALKEENKKTKKSSFAKATADKQESKDEEKGIEDEESSVSAKSADIDDKEDDKPNK